MGLICERSPLGEGGKKREKEKEKKGGAMGLGAHVGGAPLPPPPSRTLPPWQGISPTFPREGGLTPSVCLYKDGQGCTSLIQKNSQRIQYYSELRSVFTGLLPSLVSLKPGSPCLEHVLGLRLLCYANAVVLPKLRFREVYFRHLRWIGERRSSSSPYVCEYYEVLHVRHYHPIRVLTQPRGCERFTTSSTTFAGTFPTQRTTPRGMFPQVFPLWHYR